VSERAEKVAMEVSVTGGACWSSHRERKSGIAGLCFPAAICVLALMGFGRVASADAPPRAPVLCIEGMPCDAVMPVSDAVCGCGNVEVFASGPLAPPQLATSQAVRLAISTANVVVSSAAELNVALTSYKAGDVIMLRNGAYDLGGKRYDLVAPVTIVGEDRNGVTVRNAGEIRLSASNTTVGNITFDGFSQYLFRLTSGTGNLAFHDNRFTRGGTAITSYTGTHRDGAIDGLTISNSQFYDLRWAGSVGGISLWTGPVVNNVRIANSDFNNLRGRSGIVSAIVVGRSDASASNNVYIGGNRISNIIVEDEEVFVDSAGNAYGAEVHGVFLFGDSAIIEHNAISHILPAGRDHEAIYLKAENTTIRGNCVHNGGAVGAEGDIIIKGESRGNVVEGNLVTSDSPGHDAWGITTYGGVIVRNNAVVKPSTTSRGSIQVHSMGMDVVVDGNRTIVKGRNGIRVDSTRFPDGEFLGGTFTIRNNNINVLKLRDAGEFISDGGSDIVDGGGNAWCEGSSCVTEFSLPDEDWHKSYHRGPSCM
jgi:hypothetical protein